ncbi:MAG: family 16 glycosylhydrolase [Parabacteroides sp.]|nr:family 16 glycosylhydrolase [Parabacteroides sp.]
MKTIILIISTLFLTLVSCSETGDQLPSNAGNKETLITSVDLKDINDISVLLSSEIDTVNNTVTLIPKDDIDKRNLKFFATLSDGALSKPILGALTDFSNPVSYTVISESRGITRNWTVIVITKNEEALITSINDIKDENDVSVLVSSEIDIENMTATIVVKERADRKNLKLSASISEGASIDPALDTYTDFSLPVEFSITSEDGKTVNKWVINVVNDEFIDHDSGFDYDLNPSEWILDDSKSDDFDNWDETKWSSFNETSSGIFDYNAENVFSADGKLRIVADIAGEKYSAGKIKSTFEIGENSYVKIRAKTVNFQAKVTSSIRLQNEDIAPITIMETVSAGPGTFSSSLRQAENISIDSKTTLTDANLSEDYHVYGLERRNELLRFFFDGKIVWEFETSQYPGLSEQLLNMVIGIEGQKDTNPNDSRLPGYLLIDYVEVYNAVNTDEITPTYGKNLVVNPGFEAHDGDPDMGTNNPEGWSITRSSSPSDVWVFKDWRGSDISHSRFHIGMVGGELSTCDYVVSQKINNLPDGLYRLEFWAYMVEGNTEFDPLPRLFARGYGGLEKNIEIENDGPEAYDPNTDPSPWTKYVINNIYVRNGSCEIGVQAVANGKARLFVDDFSFHKVNY